jgi:enoyl-CoA hydratase/carnithine racemase
MNDAPIRWPLVTLNRPATRNAISRVTACRLAEIVRLTEEDKCFRVAILAGAGAQAFCAGPDLGEVNASGIGHLFLDAEFTGFVDAQRTKPWMAAINGFALAGGSEIALACDPIVAARTARFELPEVGRRLIAAAGGAYCGGIVRYDHCFAARYAAYLAIS